MQSLPQQPPTDTPRARTDAGALTSMMILAIVSLLLIQPFFGLAFGLQIARALIAITPDAATVSSVAMALAVLAAGLSVGAGVMMIVWRKPVTRRVILAAAWLGGPLLTATLQLFLLGHLGQPWTGIFEGDMASASAHMLVQAVVITLYVVYSRDMRARFCMPQAASRAPGEQAGEPPIRSTATPATLDDQ